MNFQCMSLWTNLKIDDGRFAYQLLIETFRVEWDTKKVKFI